MSHQKSLAFFPAIDRARVCMFWKDIPEKGGDISNYPLATGYEA